MSAGRIRARAGEEAGFTLVELLVSMALLGILMSAFALVMGTVMTRNAVITNETVLQAQVRTALNQLMKDLREASLPTASATSPFVAPTGTMSSDSITFYAPDQTYSTTSPTSYHLREIAYQLSGGNFERTSVVSSNTGGPPWTMPALGNWVTLVGTVVNSVVFTYYDGSQPPQTTTTPDAVRTVEVTLTVSIPGTTRTYTYSSSATLRETAPV